MTEDTVSGTPSGQDSVQGLEAFDAAVAAELQLVSTVPYNSREICKWFSENLRNRLASSVSKPEAPCKRCGGSGWVIIGHGDSAGADECPVCAEGDAATPPTGSAEGAKDVVAWLRANTNEFGAAERIEARFAAEGAVQQASGQAEGAKPVPEGYEKMRGGKPVTYWRDDALEAAAGIVEAYGADSQIAADIRYMKGSSATPTSPTPEAKPAGQGEAKGTFNCPVCGKDTPHHHAGVWTLTAPDGRQWHGDSPIKACREEQRSRIPDEVAVERVIQTTEEEEPDDAWRRLALQFDGHRMQAMALIRYCIEKIAPHGLYAELHEQLVKFNSAPPLSGEEVLAERIRALATPAQPKPVSADTERLDWLDANGNAVKFSKGYLGSADGWVWTDERGFHNDAPSLREAIDAALSSTPLPGKGEER